MKRLVPFYLSVMMLITFGAFAETVPQDEYEPQQVEYTPQEWDIQEKEVIEIMRQILIGQHDTAVCIRNNESYRPLNDGYDPDDEYVYMCSFEAFTDPYGTYRHWFCYAFFMKMPYRGWHIEVDSPSGEYTSWGPLLRGKVFDCRQDDDIRAAGEAIADHRDLLLSAVRSEETDPGRAVLELDTEHEYFGIWSLSYRIIPVKITSPQNAGEEEPELFAVISPEKTGNFDRQYFWKISVFSKDAIDHWSDTILSREEVPVFSGAPVFETYMEMLPSVEQAGK